MPNVIVSRIFGFKRFFRLGRKDILVPVIVDLASMVYYSPGWHYIDLNNCIFDENFVSNRGLLVFPVQG